MLFGCLDGYSYSPGYPLGPVQQFPECCQLQACLSPVPNLIRSSPGTVSTRRFRQLHFDEADGLIDPIDTLAANGAAKLSRTFRGSLAPVRRIILLSSSPDDLKKRLNEFYSDWAPDQVAEVIDQALLAFAANGIK